VWQYVAAIAAQFQRVYDGKCWGAVIPFIHPSAIAADELCISQMKWGK